MSYNKNEISIKSNKLSDISAVDAFISRAAKTYHILFPVRCDGEGDSGGGGGEMGSEPFPYKVKGFSFIYHTCFISTRRLALNGIETFS